MDIGQGLSVMLGQLKIDSWDIEGRPKNAKRGMFGFNSETNSLEYYNGSYWLAAEMQKEA
jgi:hypothetical protein